MAPVSNSLSNSTSASLIGRVRRHDAQAWCRFADIYTPLVYGWARRGGLQASDAADVVQEVFRIVAAKIDTFGRDRAQTRFRAWLKAITRNQVRLHYRHSLARPAAAGGTDAQQQFAHLPDADADADADWQEDAAEADSEVQYLLHRTLKAIQADFEPPTWQAFWAMVVDGRTASDIAETLGLSPTAVRQAKFRVLCRLREEMQGM